ncbi:hypothetical protein PO909_013332 [Leuciscus waleckii]
MSLVLRYSDHVIISLVYSDHVIISLVYSDHVIISLVYSDHVIISLVLGYSDHVIISLVYSDHVIISLVYSDHVIISLVLRYSDHVIISLVYSDHVIISLVYSDHTYEQSEWVIHIAGRLLANDSTILSLMAHNPFQDREKPRWIRGEHFRYKFTRPGSISAAQGKWWIRKRIGPYFPPVNLDGLRNYFQSRNWPLPDTD